MAEHPLILRYAARSHVGLVRAKNDDSAYAGKYLAVVADGMGGHAGGDVASASTVLDLIHLDHDNYQDDAGTHLADEIQTANSLLSELVHVNPKLAGMGTTVTALLLTGERLAYAHIGDSRAYRLKDGSFAQMSTDHTFVQRMIDEGRMTEAEAEVHPHKNVLMRVLGDVDASPELDLRYFDAAPGERWLLCSDGLNFVRNEVIEEVIRHTKSLATAADTLIELTLAAGSPDNVTVVVFEVAESAGDDTPTAALQTVPVLLDDAGDAPAAAPAGAATPVVREEPTALEELAGAVFVVGESEAAATALELRDRAEAAAPGEPRPGSGDDIGLHIRAAVVRHELSLRPHELVGAALTANAEGKIPLLAHHPATQRAATVLTHKPDDAAQRPVEGADEVPNARRRTLVLAVLGAVTAIVILAGAWAAYAWTQTQYYVGVSNGHAAIFNGVSQSLGPISLSHLQRETGVEVSSLPEYSQQLIQRTLPAGTLGDAEQIISDLQLGTGTGMPPCNAVTPSTTAPKTSTAAGTSGAATGATSAKAATPAAKATPKATGLATANDIPPSSTPTCTDGAQ
ncbi:PP2C family protein-serine/threonine phosphatase [Specibacter sp. RAF43]|uniref:PP2C family protein-serine/threonine phosphatase n=1 Tax=Specibacter sp. RAF43 TaxID=3233057 RepID=UPI003F997D80